MGRDDIRSVKEKREKETNKKATSYFRTEEELPFRYMCQNIAS